MPEQTASARQVHAVLAAALADPGLLDLWRREASVPSPAGVPAGEFEVSRIWRFSGLVTKVRHNDIRPSLPLTFRLLDYAAISIDLFASYAPVAAHQRQNGLTSKSDKIDALIEFLDGWLDRTQPVQAIAFDLIRHESSIFRLRATASARSADQALYSGSVIVRTPGAVQHAMTWNPLGIVEALQSGGDLASLPPEPGVFGYCVAEDGVRIRVVALDELAAFLMDSVDGERPLSAIVEWLQGSGVAVETSDLMGPVADLVATGLLEIAEPKPCA